MKYELKTLSFGETFGRAFNMYIDNFIALFTVCLVLNIPLIFLTVYINHISVTARLEGNLIPLFTGFTVLIIIFFICSAAETGLIIKYVSHQYLGKKINPRDFLTSIKSSLLPIIGLSFCIGLCIGIGIILAIIPLLGLLLFVVYAVIMTINFILATQVLVIEKKGVIQSMKRSWELVKGRRPGIFGYLIVVGIITLILNQLSGVIGKGLFNVIGISGIWIGAIISFFISSLTSPFPACVYVLIYFNIRIEKEGFALEHLADQFASEEEEESILHR